MRKAIKAEKTYTWQPLLLIPHSLFLRHRTRKLPYSTNDRWNPTLLRAGFKQQFTNVLRLAVTHRQGNGEVVKSLFRNFLTWVFSVPISERRNARCEQDRRLLARLT